MRIRTQTIAVIIINPFFCNGDINDSRYMVILNSEGVAVFRCNRAGITVHIYFLYAVFIQDTVVTVFWQTLEIEMPIRFCVQISIFFDIVRNQPNVDSVGTQSILVLCVFPNLIDCDCYSFRNMCVCKHIPRIRLFNTGRISGNLILFCRISDFVSVFSYRQLCEGMLPLDIFV